MLRIEMNDSLDAGTYKVEFKKDAVKSIVTEKGNKEVTTKVKYDGVTDEVKVIDKSDVTVKTVDENKNEINVDYKEKMDSSALDPANYFIDGRSLTEKYGKDNKDLTLRFKDSDKKVVLIELPKGQIEHNGLYKFEISNKVKTDSGKIVANNASEKKNVIIDLKDALHDDKAPAIDDVEFIKANSNDTKTNVIKVTFDEDLKEDIKKAEEKGIANDFEIRSNGSYMKVKSVSIGKFTDNKDEAVIVLDKEINIDVRNTTIRLTDNEDYPSADNYNEDGINIADLEGNEADATKAQTITKSEKDSALMQKIKDADQEVADKDQATKAFNGKKAEIAAENLIEADYTSESWVALQTALNFDITGKTADQINTATTAIGTARSNLVTKISVAIKAFNDKKAEIVAENLTQATYTPESWATLQTALNFDVTGKTVDEINAATTAIGTARSGLVNA